jgi:hypothetical protein
MEIDNRTEETMQATPTIAITTSRLRQPRETGLLRIAGRTLPRLQIAIVNGSEHPCWHQIDERSRR